MFCENCGLKQNEYAKFCPGCGSKIMNVQQNIDNQTYPPRASYPPPTPKKISVYPPVTEQRQPVRPAYPPANEYGRMPVSGFQKELTEEEKEFLEERENQIQKYYIVNKLKTRCYVSGILWIISFVLELLIVLFGSLHPLVDIAFLALPVYPLVKAIKTFTRVSSLSQEHSNSEENSYFMEKGSALSSKIVILIISLVLSFIFDLAGIYFSYYLFIIIHCMSLIELPAAIVDKTIASIVLNNRKLFLKTYKKEKILNHTSLRKNEDWICKKCGYKNISSDITCKDCGAYK